MLDPRPLHRDTGPLTAVVVDCAIREPWPASGARLDWTLHEVTDHNAVLRPAKDLGPYLQFVRTPDVKTMWNRVHLDVRPYKNDDPTAEAARLQALGAAAIDLGPVDVS